MEEWTKLGISRRTYFRHKSAKPNEENGTKLIFDGTNGNLVQNITKQEMQSVIDRNPDAFIPNWFRAGFPSRLESLTHEI